jgi:hypothetical protein
LTYLKTENVASGTNPNINQISNFVNGEMSGEGGKLSDGSYLISEVVMNKEKGSLPFKWNVDRQSYRQAWVDVQMHLNGDDQNPNQV